MLSKWGGGGRDGTRTGPECWLYWNRVSPQKHLRELSQGRFAGQTATTAKVLFQPSPSIKPLLQRLAIAMETQDVKANRDNWGHWEKGGGNDHAGYFHKC